MHFNVKICLVASATHHHAFVESWFNLPIFAIETIQWSQITDFYVSSFQPDWPKNIFRQILWMCKWDQISEQCFFSSESNGKLFRSALIAITDLKTERDREKGKKEENPPTEPWNSGMHNLYNRSSSSYNSDSDTNELC